MSALREAIQVAPTPPPGTYFCAGRVHVRRFAPVTPRLLQCRLGHRMRVRDRPIASTPQCEHIYKPGRQRCNAHLYLYRLSPRRYLALDVTHEEADMIHRDRMELDDVIVYFGLEMPRVV